MGGVIFAALALLSLSLPAGASAAPPWSEPDIVSPGVAPSTLAFDARGRAMLAGGGPAGWSTATRAPGAAAFDSLRPAPNFGIGPPLGAGPLLFGTSRAVGLDTRKLPDGRCAHQERRDTYSRLSLRARFGRSDGSFGSPDSITTLRYGPFLTVSEDPKLASNDAGQVLAAWATESPDCLSSAVRIAVRRPGNGFGPPLTLRSGGRTLGVVAAAVGEGGDMVVAWQRSGAVEARYRRAGGRWGPVDRLGSAERLIYMEAAVSQNGRAYVAWAQPPTKKPRRPRRLSVAVRTASARSFGKPQSLEPNKLIDRYGIHLEIAHPGNGAVLAWTGTDSGGRLWRARVAGTGKRGRFEAPRTVSPPGASFGVGDLAVGRNGGQVLALLRGATSPTAFASIAFPGAAFGPLEQVSASGVSPVRVAIDPTTFRPTMVWSASNGLNASSRAP